FFFFFFQAEDGIRDGHVTGVQTCALPILWQVVPCRNQSANRKNSRIGKSAISLKQPLLFSSKQWESSSLGRATRRSVILAQVGVDNALAELKRKMAGAASLA